MKTKVFLIFTAVALYACSSTVTSPANKNDTPQAAAHPLDGAWELTSMQGFALDTIAFAAGLPMLQLHVADSSVIGFTGCNRLNATVAATASGGLTFGLLATTKRYCVTIPESAYLDFLTKTTGYTLTGETLTLTAAGDAVLHFKKTD